MKSPVFKKGSVVTIGTFDGVHQGHQAILRRAAALARRRGLPCVAITFSRPPRLFFFPQEGPSLITLPEEKEALLRSHGVDRVEVLPFGRALSRLTAEAFFERYFLRRYKAREIVVGYNFGFGRDRRGDGRFLEERGRALGIPVHVEAPVCQQRVPVSSGQIRENLRRGELAEANRKLGYPYFLSGLVVRGDGRGRQLGYPTANLDVPGDKLVPPGVYAVRVALPHGLHRRGMCNVGVRPTLGTPNPRPGVEVHILDFVGNLPGKVLRLEFIRKIRAEKKFPTLKALARQLRADEKAARRLLAL